MFRNGRKIESYKGARNLNDLADFVTTNKEQAGAAAADDGKVPEPAAKEAEPAVVKLEKDNFEEKTKTGVAFVKFYAPWYVVQYLILLVMKFNPPFTGVDTARD